MILRALTFSSISCLTIVTSSAASWRACIVQGVTLRSQDASHSAQAHSHRATEDTVHVNLFGKHTWKGSRGHLWTGVVFCWHHFYFCYEYRLLLDDLHDLVPLKTCRNTYPHMVWVVMLPPGCITCNSRVAPLLKVVIWPSGNFLCPSIFNRVPISDTRPSEFIWLMPKRLEPQNGLS